jgi:hypothetical protein
MYPNQDFWFENKASGNPDEAALQLKPAVSSHQLCAQFASSSFQDEFSGR